MRTARDGRDYSYREFLLFYGPLGAPSKWQEALWRQHWEQPNAYRSGELAAAIDRGSTGSIWRRNNMNVLTVVLHKRLAERYLIDRSWSSLGHWGRCGQSCPCCRSLAPEDVHDGDCAACRVVDQVSRLTKKIFDFVALNRYQIIALLRDGKLRSLRQPLPWDIWENIRKMLPRFPDITLIAGVAGLALHIVERQIWLELNEETELDRVRR
jgi:hypothetical protein